jgi:hypothetical protein
LNTTSLKIFGNNYTLTKELSVLGDLALESHLINRENTYI